MTDETVAIPSNLNWTDADVYWPEKPAWMSEGECRGIDPNIFFAEPGNGHDPEQTSMLADAKRICAGCPVREQCLEWALQRREAGIWGGTTENERRVIRRERGGMPRQPIPITHGTETGYNRGCREACCREAHALAKRLRADRQRDLYRPVAS